MLVDEQVAEVVITYHAIGQAVEEGQTVVYVGTCGVDGVSWRLSGSVPEKFLPRS